MKLEKFADLTWDDLTAWAGRKVVARGKSYRDAVEDLRVTADGRLLAWVRGGSLYATAVGLSGAGKAVSECTCPYGAACKHAVAVILVYLDAAKAGKAVPAAAGDDDRFGELAASGDEAEDDDDGDDGGDGEDDEDDGEDDDGEDEDDWENAGKGGGRPAGRRAAPEKDAPSNVDAYLSRLPKDGLLKLVKEALAESPELRERLSDRIGLAGGKADVAGFVKSARKAIREASAEPDWTRHWSHESYTPDYGPVKKKLEALLKAGHPDEVVALGNEVLSAGRRQIEQSDDEGETGFEIAECLGVVFRALAKSTMPDAEKLLWEADARLRDDYGCLDDVPGLWGKARAFLPAVWSGVADALLARLALKRKEEEGGPSDPYSRRWQRERLMDRAVEALERAGRPADVIALLAREAPDVCCYGKLADRLAAQGAADEAEAWCRKGFAATLASAPGLAWELERRLREHAQKKGNRPLVAAFRAAEFFSRPSVAAYRDLEKACAPLGHWERVRERVLRWLEKGGDASAPGQDWPLPDTGLPSPKRDDRGAVPQTQMLIEIAILEKRHDDVLAWYAVVQKKTEFFVLLGGLGALVADTVNDTHPDAALDIWWRLAENEIARVTPSAYEVAGGYLGKMKAVYARLGRSDEWRRLLDGLRTANRARRRMLEVLDRLDGVAPKPVRIIDSKR
jgi:uncharacterized Zn finger protein